MNIIMEGVEVSQEGWSSDKKTIQGLGMRLHHTKKKLKKDCSEHLKNLTN